MQMAERENWLQVGSCGSTTYAVTDLSRRTMAVRTRVEFKVIAGDRRRKAFTAHLIEDEPDPVPRRTRCPPRFPILCQCHIANDFQCWRLPKGTGSAGKTAAPDMRALVWHARGSREQRRTRRGSWRLSTRSLRAPPGAASCRAESGWSSAVETGRPASPALPVTVYGAVTLPNWPGTSGRHSARSGTGVTGD
jgi:hypothetical protein